MHRHGSEVLAVIHPGKLLADAFFRYAQGRRELKHVCCSSQVSFVVGLKWLCVEQDGNLKENKLHMFLPGLSSCEYLRVAETKTTGDPVP